MAGGRGGGVSSHFFNEGSFRKAAPKRLKSKPIQTFSMTRVDASLEPHNTRFGMTVLLKGENVLCQALPKNGFKTGKTGSAAKPLPLLP